MRLLVRGSHRVVEPLEVPVDGCRCVCGRLQTATEVYTDGCRHVWGHVLGCAQGCPWTCWKCKGERVQSERERGTNMSVDISKAVCRHIQGCPQTCPWLSTDMAKAQGWENTRAKGHKDRSVKGLDCTRAGRHKGCRAWGHEGMRGVREQEHGGRWIFESPPALLQHVVLRCSHHFQVEPPSHLCLQNSKLAFVGPHQRPKMFGQIAKSNH